MTLEPLSMRPRPSDPNSKYRTYTALYDWNSNIFSNRQDKEVRLLNFKHTCESCNYVRYFKQDWVHCHLVEHNDLPTDPSLFRADVLELVLDGRERHLFRVCCLAYGVGNWSHFQKLALLKNYSHQVFEFTAHVELGVYDLTNFWGLSVWPPWVKKETIAFNKKNRELDPNVKWLPRGDPLRDLFVDPVQFCRPGNDQNIFLAPAILSAVRMEFGASKSQIHMAQEALGFVPVGNFSSTDASDVFNFSRSVVTRQDLAWNHQFPFVSASTHLQAMLFNRRNNMGFGDTTADQQDKLLALEQQVLSAGGNFDKVLDLFRKQHQKNRQSQVKQGNVSAQKVQPQTSTPLPPVNNTSSDNQPSGTASSAQLKQVSSNEQVALQMPAGVVVEIRDDHEVKAGQQLVEFCEKTRLRTVGRLAMSIAEMEAQIEATKESASQMHYNFTRDMEMMNQFTGIARALL